MQYQFVGLSRSEIRDPNLPNGVEVTEINVPKGALGDISNYIISFSGPLLTIVVAYLIQKRKSAKFKQKYIEIHPDGTRIEKTIEYDISETDGINAETAAKILKEINKN